MTQFFAHSAPTGGGPKHLVRDHLTGSSGIAQTFAELLGLAEEAKLATLLHDIGKYGDLFQRRLDSPATIHHIDHWTIGAWIAATKFQQPMIALAIQGHHVGLQRGDIQSLRNLQPEIYAANTKQSRLSEIDTDLLLSRLSADGVLLPASWKGALPKLCHGMLRTRMLFSTLVDADYLDTESHFNRSSTGPKQLREKGPLLDVEASLVALEHFRTTVGKNANPKMKELRGEVSNACAAGAAKETGVFTLTAPTGSGKTLAMLRFALLHAKNHGLKRIVVILPFLTLIEQTAEIYKEIFKNFPPNYVLEDHSLARDEIGGMQEQDRDDVANEAKLLSENWDAPIVITTNVRFFESLHQNRPGACRKLHRLARSVILCDEVQTLPTELATCTLATLATLAQDFGSTVVFATATQPAFEELAPRVSELTPHEWRPREIVTDPKSLFQRSDRVAVDWRSESQSWESIADEISDLPGALAIVNTRKDATNLTQLIQRFAPEIPLLHLSTNMCVAHRKQVLDRIKGEDFESKGIVIATQCVEAGVDLDFLRVYRAWGPLDSVAQAAGRCNRNWNLKRGEVVVFMPEDPIYPPGFYKQATSSAEITVRAFKEEARLNNPELFNAFFKKLYRAQGATKKEGDLKLAIEAMDFVEVAKLYRLIEESGVNVVVRVGSSIGAEHLARNAALLEELETEKLTYPLMKKLRTYTVSTFLPKSYDLPLTPLRDKRGDLVEGWFLVNDPKYYDPLLGLRFNESSAIMA